MNTINTHAIPTMPKRFLRIHDVTQKISFQKSWIYKKMDEGRFPRPIKIGGASRWLETDIDGWIERQHQKTQSQTMHYE